MSPVFEIKAASATDEDAILRVMQYWNMHHVPSPEMEQLDLQRFFVAHCGLKIVGAAGYEILSPELGKTTLLGVLPDYLGYGLGKKLQHVRCEKMYQLGAKRVITNADRSDTINWYKKHFGYVEVGTLDKIVSFGDPDIERWTTLEMDLERYMSEKKELPSEL